MRSLCALTKCLFKCVCVRARSLAFKCFNADILKWFVTSVMCVCAHLNMNFFNGDISNPSIASIHRIHPSHPSIASIAPHHIHPPHPSINRINLSIINRINPSIINRINPPIHTIHRSYASTHPSYLWIHRIHRIHQPLSLSLCV